MSNNNGDNDSKLFLDLLFLLESLTFALYVLSADKSPPQPSLLPQLLSADKTYKAKVKLSNKNNKSRKSLESLSQLLLDIFF